MLREFTVKFSNFLLSLSDAIDLASSQLALHQMRTAFGAWQAARLAGFTEERIEKLFIAALFHDIGALSLEDKIRLHESEEIDVVSHCILGEAFFELSPLFAPSARIVRFHHTSWKDWNASIDSADVLDSQILYLSDLLERSIRRGGYILHQAKDIRDKMAALAGTGVHGDVAELFAQLTSREDFWLDLTSPRLYSLLLHSGPFQRDEIGYRDIFSLSSLFRHVVDFKSRFTATHSTGVAECAVMLSRHFGLTDVETQLMEVAGYFHDLGKLAVPNSILEKPAKLSPEEFAVMKQHTYFTYTVLNTIGGFDQIAEWAAFHHEKLDGSGYPFHVPAGKINTGARIMAVADIYTALAEDRPYRKSLERKEIENILTSQTEGRAIDGTIVRILRDNFPDIAAAVKEKQDISREVFEQKFARLYAN